MSPPSYQVIVVKAGWYGNEWLERSDRKKTGRKGSRIKPTVMKV